MSALRTTWQVSRPQIIYPTLGASTTATQANVVVGTYIGDQIAVSGLVLQQDVGVPFATVDVIAILPAGVDVQDGDTLVDLERDTMWQVKNVSTYTRKSVVALIEVKNKSIKIVKAS